MPAVPFPSHRSPYARFRRRGFDAAARAEIPPFGRAALFESHSFYKKYRGKSLGQLLCVCCACVHTLSGASESAKDSPTA